MTRALNRNIPFWILLVASLALIAAGLLTALDHLGTMTASLTDGSATGLEVYAGQSWIVIGATLLGTGVLGLLLTLALTVASGLLAAAAPSSAGAVSDAGEGPTDQPDVVEASDDTAMTEDGHSEDPASADPVRSEETQNGSSGSIATATKISVR